MAAPFTLQGFFPSVAFLSAATGYQHSLPFERATKQLEHFQNKIYQTIASGLRSHQAAAIAAPLACQNRREVIGELLVSTKHETDFALANTNISGRDIPLRT